MATKANGKKKLGAGGSNRGTRSYEVGVGAHVTKADLADLAKKSARAIEGKDGPKLKKEAKAGKAAPKAARAAALR